MRRPGVQERRISRMVVKQIKQKQSDGEEIVLDIGAKAENIETDSDHQFVTAAEKEALSTGSEAAQSASEKIGSTGDTGGGTSAGTVMAKLNKLISDLATHTSRWTNTRAGYIDTINTNAKNSADRIGSTGDTGGSSSAGTVMGKLNKIISDLASHAASWTSTRAGYIDTIKSDVAANKTNVSAIKTSTDKIGSTGDTGGSVTAGSIFGKLNKLVSDLTTHMSRWTSTRAEYIDAINNSTETNNTASASGTLSQKMSHLIDLVGNKGTVKSVQRGTAPPLLIHGTVKRTGYEGSSSNPTVEYFAIDRSKDVTIIQNQIEISEVNPSKCVVIIDGVAGMAIGYNVGCMDTLNIPIVSGLNETTLTLRTSIQAATKFTDHRSGGYRAESSTDTFRFSMEALVDDENYLGVLGNLGDVKDGDEVDIPPDFVVSWQVIEFY
mgnify:CR=1 FL=1